MEIRRAASILPGMPLEIRVHDGVIEIEPQPVPVKLERKGRLLVANPTVETPQLPADTVNETIHSVRGSRRHSKS